MKEADDLGAEGAEPNGGANGVAAGAVVWKPAVVRKATDYLTT